MCGGDQEAFEEVKPVMATYARNVHLNGQAGQGQHVKMVNQIVLAGNMIGLVEGLLYASKMGLDLTLTLQTIGSGAASSAAMVNLGPRMVNRNFDPGFYVEHYIKDL
jgi:3-hydroxyisobutyrate dehydrogenase